MTDLPFASPSVPRHLLRGVLGLAAFSGAIGLLGVVGPFALLLLPVGFVALRGCPTCWAIGLAQTVARGRRERDCDESGCTPRRAVS